MFLILGAAIALIWANSPFAAAYDSLLTLDAVKEVAIFTFFVSLGIELRHEMTKGALSKPRQAIVPIIAAMGGMLVPVIIFSAINFGQPSEAGWGVPMSTDVAFALAILAIAGKFLPPQVRIFLLTVSVVDDTLTILIMSIFYSTNFHLLSLVSLIGIITGALIPQRWPVLSWLTPTVKYASLPIFALFSAGVRFEDLGANFGTSALTLGIILAMVIGKPLGVLGTTWVVTKTGLGKFAAGIKWPDLLAIGSLFGMCFTVALIMSELSFGLESAERSVANLSVFIGSLASALLAVVALQIRKRSYVNR